MLGVPPRSLAADEFGLVEPVHALGHRVDAPICRECRVGWSRSRGEGDSRPVVVDERVVDLSCDEALEAADDVLLR